MRPETERWLKYAQGDLETAKVTFDGKLWTATSFHAQQAAEKALKALWFEREDAEPPRTHDLVRLAQDAGYADERLAGLEELTQSYIVSRYPDATDLRVGEIDRNTADEHRSLAEEVVRWARGQLQMDS